MLMLYSIICLALDPSFQESTVLVFAKKDSGFLDWPNAMTWFRQASWQRH